MLRAAFPGNLRRAAKFGPSRRELNTVCCRHHGSGMSCRRSVSRFVNPIEQVFATHKHMLRNAAERTMEATWKMIGHLLDCLSPSECGNYLKNAGYGSM